MMEMFHQHTGSKEPAYHGANLKKPKRERERTKKGEERKKWWRQKTGKVAKTRSLTK